ncbi:glycosyltransferase family 9 protein [uncultured Psychroserpens sp.]|uniref:glycosyltransferase family 9 protein n=1 Tax=uncultured Psychroserpens sp. TaxID=255436 RepID=UPI00261DBD90|nr:glycosyltransferase family 9 protein [uncultured Psychroserpens sp.]
MNTEKSAVADSILVYKSYGGIGDIFFTLPSIYMLKQQFKTITFATQPRLVNLFQTHLKGISVIDENSVDESNYDTVIELGNYPRFNNDLEKRPQIVYHTHKKVKQHSIEHYKDGIVAEFPHIKKTNERYPYFDKVEASELYYTIHPGAGFLLKAWPIDYYAELIELINECYPYLKAKIIIGPNDPNPEPHFKTSNLNYELVTGDIDEVALAVSGAQFHIGNDAGITHLAGAFNIPILTIYGPTGPGSWGAFSEHVELIWGKRGNCSLRCNYNVILNCEDRVCLNNVKPSKMMFYLMKLLNRILNETSNMYMLNPDYQIHIEDDSFIFKSHENEYLIEISDLDSRTFMLDHVKQIPFDIKHMPSQFKSVFDAMLQLHLFAAIPEFISKVKS